MQSDGRGAAELRFRDLGPLEVDRGGEPVPLGGARLTAALSLLLVHAGRHVSADALTEAMWGAESRPRSPSTLDSHVWRLRKALEPQRNRGAPSQVLRHEATGYRLLAEPATVDSLRFEQLTSDAADLLAGGRPDEARDRAEQAMALWRGRPYPTVADASWAAAAVARLEEVRGQLRELLAEALLGTGSPQRALLELEPAVAETPLRERLWTLRMLAQHRLGRADEALRTYRQVRELFLEELGLEPGAELRELHRRILAEDPTLVGPSAPAAAPAPAQEREPEPAPPAHEIHLPHRPSTLVGRTDELAALTGLVTEVPVLSLVGAAGCGKTRLAVEIAREAAPRIPGGVWFVDLTAAADADDVLSAISSALGYAPEETERPREALAGFLRARPMLLLLDNCEHVLDPVADLVDEWFLAPAELTVLATSREPLEVDGERVHLLGPLPLPDDDREVTDSPAVALLLDRLAAAGADPDDMGLLTHAVRIAAAVDGVPLALELAAARARAFSLEEIAHQVTADPSSLARVGRGSDHHRTVRAAIEQSYALLPPDEAAVHRGVAVLPGPFTVAAARAVTGEDGADGAHIADTADTVARLVHRSLLVPLGPARPGGPSRFTQLATIRGHAGHAARAAGELADLRERRDRWTADLVGAKPPLGHAEEATWFDALDDDLPALRATLQHRLVDAPSAEGVAMTARLGTYWYFRSKAIEGRAWAERALAHEEGADRLSAALVRLTLAHHLASGGRTDLADPHVERAADFLDGGPDGTGSPIVAEVYTLLAHSLFVAGALDRGRQASQRVAAAAADGDPELRLLADLCVVMDRSSVGTIDGDALTELHDRAREAGNRHVALVVSGVAVLAAIRGGDLAAGLAWSDRMITHRLVLGVSDGPVALELRATLAALAGEPLTAVRLYAAARTQALRNGLRWPVVPSTPDLLDRATGALTDSEVLRAHAEGERLTLADVVTDLGVAESAAAS
ncbi:BTAD domain-containing putative transcriptional regulator [Pseudonocardia halophobica]|uniref:BTAD domain-containing putative transcriptional regulator n=1 Tax=Pseudonocardia halophobica TaxID=29401 RepID=UPI003D8D0B44